MSFHSLSSLPPEDQVLFNQYGRGPTAPIPYQTIPEAFEAIVSSHPSATAVRECFGPERSVTYAELEWRSNIVANTLTQQYGVGRGQRVVCVFSRCIEMCAIILGVLKAGAQYVPIDGAVMVDDSLRHVIVDSGAKAVVCLSKFREKVQRCMPLDRSAEVFELDASDRIWRNGNASRPFVDIHTADGAYVIYTSGTTGKPKGVDCSHENVCNNLLNEPAKLGITVGVNVACVLMLAFDMCAWEVLATLMNGGTLNLRGGGRPGGDADVWNACLRRVDVVISTPTGAQKYFPRWSDFPNLKTIVVGGEPCPVGLAEEWSPQVRFINICGPTEVTILNTAQVHQPNTSLTIGKPLPNTNVYILDDHLHPVRIGETGLMWVGGLSVSRGYVNLPDLTAQRYKPDKFTMDGRMMFNTGDLGRWDAHGELEHLGRKDDQVKIKGFRVELDGVSACMESFPGVAKACALKMGERLVGFYSTTNDATNVAEAALSAHLATQLNHYACPSQLFHVSSMPMTAGGKIDKKALAAGPPQHLEVDSSSSSSSPSSPSSSSSSIMSGRTLHAVEDVEKRGKNMSSETTLDLVKDAKSFSETSVDLVDPEKAVELPQKRGFHGQRWLRHKGLNAYKKLFIFIFLLNLIVFIAMLVQANGQGLPVDKVSTAVAANLFASVLFRQDLFVNFVFWFSTLLPTSTPLCIRRHFARCYHMGGVHTGAAVTATLWWIIFAAQSSLYYVEGSRQYPINSATIGLTFVILLFLAAILGMAYPSVRVKMHDQFEWTHRFAGWTTLGLFWAHIVVTTASLKARTTTLGEAVATTPAVWLLALATLSVALPWMRLRKVDVVAEPLSNHAIRLHFNFAHPPPGRAIRISDNPMREWHAFACIMEPNKPGFSIVVSRAGDWTGRIIENPPTRIWTRGVPASGVLRMATLFQKVVLVATGSGIGPCLPVILAGKVPCRVFWSTPNPEKTFGKEIIDGILANDPEAVIWNTRERGRPNMSLEAYKLYKASGAECVCVISNGPVTSKLVYDLEARGVPAFGPIFDS